MGDHGQMPHTSFESVEARNRGRDYLTGVEKLRVHFRMKEILTSALTIIPRQPQWCCCEANTSAIDWEGEHSLTTSTTHSPFPVRDTSPTFFLLSRLPQPPWLAQKNLRSRRISEVWLHPHSSFPWWPHRRCLFLLQDFFISSSSSSLSSNPSLSFFSIPFSFSSFSPSSSLNSFIVV